jgi:hypothetical protein
MLAGNYEGTRDYLQMFMSASVPEVPSLEASFLLQDFVEGWDIVNRFGVKLRCVDDRKVGA